MTTYLSWIVSTIRKGNSYTATVAQGLIDRTKSLDYSTFCYSSEHTFEDEEHAIESAKDFIQVLEGITEF